jgi:hypothetical protein
MSGDSFTYTRMFQVIAQILTRLFERLLGTAVTSLPRRSSRAPLDLARINGHDKAVASLLKHEGTGDVR